MVHARDYDDAHFELSFPERERFSGIEQLKYDMRLVFMDNALGQAKDLVEQERSFAPDFVLGDPAFFGGSSSRS